MTEMLIQARHSLTHILPITLLVLTLAVTMPSDGPARGPVDVSGLSALFSVVRRQRSILT